MTPVHTLVPTPISVLLAEDPTESIVRAIISVHEGDRLWEYAVMVTDVKYPLASIGQLYRDRADCENGFDELKNQWGLSGFTTQDINRFQTTLYLTSLHGNSGILRAKNAMPSRSWKFALLGWVKLAADMGVEGRTADRKDRKPLFSKKLFKVGNLSFLGAGEQWAPKQG